MRAAAWVLFAIAALGCSRSEESLTPRDVRTPSVPSVANPAPSVPAGPDSGSTAADARCIVPTAATAPPPAARATNCPLDPSAGAAPDLPRAYVSFPDAAGAPRIGVEVAREEAQRARGLMYRTELPDQQGMLFSWPNEAQRSFWMRNTCIPLDMLFIALDGTIAGILEQVPTMNEQARSVPCPAAHVLEVNAGWTRRHAVKAGMRMVIE